jgi:hypothetical protein
MPPATKRLRASALILATFVATHGMQITSLHAQEAGELSLPELRGPAPDSSLGQPNPPAQAPGQPAPAARGATGPIAPLPGLPQGESLPSLPQAPAMTGSITEASLDGSYPPPPSPDQLIEEQPRQGLPVGAFRLRMNNHLQGVFITGGSKKKMIRARARLR